MLKAAERVDRLQELGSTMRGLAARGLAESADMTLFVNLHPEDLSDENFYAANAPLTLFAKRVVLELTELVKLDMELIRDIHKQEMKRKIVRSMVEMRP